VRWERADQTAALLALTAKIMGTIPGRKDQRAEIMFVWGWYFGWVSLPYKSEDIIKLPPQLYLGRTSNR
jgi:hypothetical protein